MSYSKKSISGFDLKDIISTLSGKRPYFHSEADFQFELARLIEHEYDVDVRLEKPEKGCVAEDPEKRIYVDIVLKKSEEKIAIELKYKTKKAVIPGEKGEQFELANQSAQDLGRYDFWKDVKRLQSLKKQGYNKGFAVFITNDTAYQHSTSIGFSLHKDVFNNLDQEMKWKKENDPREETSRKAFSLDPIYPKAIWEKYSDYPKGEFRYLLIEV